MRKSVDFSKGERGKFYRPGVKLRTPVYLDDEVERAVVEMARSRRKDISDLVNDLLRSDLRLTKSN